MPIRYHPDEAGLIGCLHLAPSWIFEGHDSILAVDIGGTNIRCGVVKTAPQEDAGSVESVRLEIELWRHADDEPTREGAIKKLVKMLKELIERGGRRRAASSRPSSACPAPASSIPMASIEKGAQNLPGNWESSNFNLPAELVEAIPLDRRPRHRRADAQ